MGSRLGAIFTTLGFFVSGVFMLPAVANRFQPALTSLQLFSAAQARRTATEGASEPGRFQPAGIEPPAPKNMKAINDYYFGNHLTVTEAMTRLFERLVGDLNDKLSVGRDGDTQAAAGGNEWRSQVLRESIPVGSDKDFSLPEPGRNGVSFQQTASALARRFNLDALSLDTGLMKELEQLVGFKLDGMTVKDLVQAFIDPNGESAGKVRGVLSEGLAGTEGSKTSERLADAVEGPKTAEQVALDISNRTGREEIDDETLAEDLDRLNAAKAGDRIAAAQAEGEALTRLLEKVEGDGTQAPTPDALLARLALRAEVLETDKAGEPAPAQRVQESATGTGAAAGQEQADPDDERDVDLTPDALQRFYLLADALWDGLSEAA